MHYTNTKSAYLHRPALLSIKMKKLILHKHIVFYSLLQYFCSAIIISSVLFFRIIQDGNLSLTADITPAIDVKPESVIEHSNTPLSAPVLIADAFIISFLYILITFLFYCL